MRSPPLTVLAAVLLALAACGGGSDGGGEPAAVPAPAPSPLPAPSPSPVPSPAPTAGPIITIQGMAFEPPSLDAAPGAVVTVLNLDAMAHSVTSQSVPGAFTPGGVAGVAFDTGAFVGRRTFTIPANAAVGTRVPFYCSTHGATMATPNGELRIVSAPATP